MPAQHTIEDGKMIFAFPPRMDTVHCQETEEDLLNQSSGHPGEIVFDLQGVQFISSMFLRLCIGVIKQKGEENFSFIHALPPVKKVLKITGFDHLIRDR